MNSVIEKKIYFSPQIEEVRLDHEISLQLQSPPVGPDEPGYIGSSTLDCFKNDPYNVNRV